ncbi:hypothetical protein IHE44_0014516 [Lamprotornis superbus]|uniref:Beta-crystallin A2 n=1 Tax=Lamprotornis superbus TaxID=245042 RepID=A0A835P1C4_9PASS|nr:hypothetical protein IHE44_0014516 [Lamprotornis superbus]
MGCAAGWLGADGGHLPWSDTWGSASSRATRMTSSEAMDTLGQYKITVWEEENFQGKRCEFLMECPSIMERGFRKIRSIKVESGPWVGFEYPEYQGQQFILEKGDYPRWEAWSGNSGYRTEHLLSFRPVKCAVSYWDTTEGGVRAGRASSRQPSMEAMRDRLKDDLHGAWDGGVRYTQRYNHNDSKVILYEAENFQGHKFELSDDYPSLQAMGWGNKEVASIKVNAGAWVAYQYPGYRGYQYVLERDRQNGEFKKYNEYSSQAHTNQIQSIRRVQH